MARSLGAVLRPEGLRLAIVAAALAVPLAYLYWRVLLPGRVLCSNDIRLLEIPMFAWVQARLHHGVFPLIAPIYGGFPIYADPEALAFYPPAFVAGFLPALAGFQAMMVFHLIGSFAGCYFLGRQLALDRASSLLVGVLWMSSGFFVTSALGIPTMLYGLAWWPWLLWSMLRLDRQLDAGRFGAALGFGVLEILAGHPHMAFFFALLWALWLAVGPLERRRRTALASCGLAVAVLALTAFAWMPWRMLGAQTMRASPSEWFVRLFEMPPSWLPGIILPRHDDSRFAHFGLIAALLALAGAWHRRRAGLGLIAIIAVYMALASINPLYRIIPHIPVWNQFRAPVRYVAIALFISSILAGYGLARLRRRGWLQAAVLALVAVELMVVNPGQELCLVSFTRYMRNSVGVEALRSRPKGPYYFYSQRPMRLLWGKMDAGRAKELRDPRFRLMSDENLLWDLPGVQGYSPLTPVRQHRFLVRYGGSSNAGNANHPQRPGELVELRRLGCRYVLSTVALPELARYPTSWLSDGMVLYDLGPAPLAILSGGGEIRGIAAGANGREVEYLCSEPQKLIFTTGYWPEYKATLDGGRWPVTPDGPNPAISVPKGRHRVRLAYAPSSLRSGLAISAFSLLVFVGALFGARRRRMHGRPKPSITDGTGEGERAGS